MEEEDPVGEVPSQGYKVVAFRSCLSLTDSVEHQIQRSLVIYQLLFPVDTASLTLSLDFNLVNVRSCVLSPLHIPTLH